MAGIAGTSAGAIIAALTWAGYKPDQLQAILAETFAAPNREAFFGPYPDRQVPSFHALLRRLRAIRVGLSADSPPWLPAGLGPRYRSARQLVTLLRLATWLARNIGRLARRRGLLRAEGFESQIEALLRRAPFLAGRIPDHHRGPLTFADVARARRNLIPLFLMVTDADRHALRIVSSIDPACAALPIARAVRASAGFPIFFQPVELGGSANCIDGGLISNVPTWVFDQAFRAQLRQLQNPVLVRLASLPWIHVALRLDSPAPIDPNATSGRAYLRAIWTLLTGSARRTLEDRMMALVSTKQFTVLPLSEPPPPGTSPSGVLDFAALADPGILDACFARGRAAAQRAIDPKCFRLPAPEPVVDILQDLALKATAALGPHLRSRVRARVFLYAARQHGPARLHRAFEIGVDPSDADAAAPSPMQANLATLTYLSGQVLLANIEHARLYPAPPPGEDPFDPASRTPQTWLLSVPIFDELDTTPHLVAAEDAGSLILDKLGPIYGVLHLDADLRYSEHFPMEPIDQTVVPSVRLAFDSTRAAAERLGILLNAFWMEPT